MKNKTKLAIIIPAHNEEKRIERTLEEYIRFFRKIKKERKLDFEIVVVANGCRDRTVKVVYGVKKKLKAREIVLLDFVEAGKGFAIKKGFEYALQKNFDLIGFVDADMSTPPQAFYDLIKKIDGYDGVIASRWIRGAKIKYSLPRKIQSRVFNFIVRSLFFFSYRDTQCGAKIFKKQVVSSVLPDLTLTKWAFDVNLLHIARKFRFRIKEVPTVWIERTGSKINFKTPIMMFLALIRLRVIYSPIEKLLRPFRPMVHFVYNFLEK